MVAIVSTRSDAVVHAPWAQRVAFHLALVVFVFKFGCDGGYYHLDRIGAVEGEREFFKAMFPWTLIAVVLWIADFVLVGNSIVQARRASWYGLAAFAMLAVTAAPFALAICGAYRDFLTGP